MAQPLPRDVQSKADVGLSIPAVPEPQSVDSGHASPSIIGSPSRRAQHELELGSAADRGIMDTSSTPPLVFWRRTSCSSLTTTDTERRGLEMKWSQVVPIDMIDSNGSAEVGIGRGDNTGAWCSDPLDFDYGCMVACCCPCAVAGWNWHEAGLGSCATMCIPVGILFCSAWLCVMLLFVYPPDPQQHPLSAIWLLTLVQSPKCCLYGPYADARHCIVLFVIIGWLAFLASLCYVRWRLARKYGVTHSECDSLISCCSGYAFLLGQERRHVMWKSLSGQ